MEKVFSYLKQLLINKFYGEVRLRFEAGKIVHITKEENIKPDSL